ncbi:hypothetical protein NBRC116601_21190 [Cognatishimia sp. WU-CL00825]|uniref:winged helix-turn-helix transcriptional regulator n=1 Tax=Cognatishimia sp. WU-CL00825 TaxID=3127658 RepID=UPI0031065A1D
MCNSSFILQVDLSVGDSLAYCKINSRPYIVVMNAKPPNPPPSKSGRKPPWTGCPTRYVAGIIGDKWCFVLLRDILLHGKRFYSEFLASPEGISTNILADRLAKLEDAGMLQRETDPRKGSRVCYFPTQKSRALLPAFLGMMVWSTQFDTETEAPDSFASAFLDDPTATVKWYEAEIERVDAEIRQG